MVAEFAEAMMKLEELIYVVYGSVPDYENGVEWYNRDNPRCLWPDQTSRFEGFNPHRYHYDWFQYATAGWAQAESSGFDENLGVAAPFRTRSGDPAFQYALAQHEAMFPAGSVERDDGSAVHDPTDEDAIEVRWTPPASPVVDIVSVTLKTNVGNYTMTDTAGVWKATIPAQDQDDVVYWYIHLVAREGELDVDYYEPTNPAGGAPVQRTPPDDPHDRQNDAQYTYVVFEHIAGIYSRGFPEMITRLGGPHDDPPGLMKTTDPWQFDKLEDIQPFHINAARFLLDSLGDVLQHSPHLRGTPEACCWDMHIRWRWTGSNVHPQYRSGGKGGTDDIHPLHNSPTENAAGSPAARRTWRGMPSVYKDDPFGAGWPSNAEFGGNESWLTVYREVFSDDPNPLDTTPGRFWDRGHDAGLQPGDVIAIEHLKEIIAAVNYLINNGAWVTEAQHSAPMTPWTAWGYDCSYSFWYAGSPQEEPLSCWRGGDPNVGQCCKTCVSPWAWPDDCEPHDTPTWAECTGNGRCNLRRWQTNTCKEATSTDPAISANPGTIKVDCDHTGTDVKPGGAEASYDCGVVDIPPDFPLLCGAEAKVYGYSYFACGPSRHNNSPGEGVYEPSGDPMWSAVDTDHGNGIRKLRRKDWPTPGGYHNLAMPSFGNSYESVTHCRNDAGAPGHVDVGFEQVTPVKFEGTVTNWFGDQACAVGEYITGVPWSPVPGLGYYALDGDPLCSFADYTGALGYRVTEGQCAFDEDDFNHCKGDTCYVRIDLNLQSGVPRLKAYDMDIVGMDDGGGPTTPTVYPWSDCPCSTDPERSDVCN